MKMLDELIETDPQNTEFPEFQFTNFTRVYGDAQIKTGDFEGAIKSYRRALEKNTAYPADSPETKKQRKSLVKMRFGDIDFFKAQKETGELQLKNLSAARDFYLEAVELFSSGKSSANREINYLNEKIAVCRQKLGD